VGDDPEIATNQEWRGIMLRARKDRGWSQKELGDRVGTSQNIISLIESGGVESSAYIMPICRLLKIPPPMHFENEWQKKWHELGRLVREQSEEDAEALVRMAEALLRKTTQTPETTPGLRDKHK
jgi:transcriptional regulator with XRE-family HTH domain